MSVLSIGPEYSDDGLTAESAISDRMPGGIAMSAALHVGLVTLILVGLPTLFHQPPPRDMPIAVELVTIAPETRATHPNPNQPVPEAKPDIPQPLPPAPVPPPKPAPPEPVSEPPPSSAAPPPPPPEPPKPEVKPEPTPPPPPPPVPKPEAKPEPNPPPPPPKPEHKPKPPEKSPQPAFDQLMKQLDKPQKQDPAKFDSLLKNLAKTDAAKTDESKPQHNKVAAAAAPSSQPKAPLGSQLSASEIDLIREQIARCWNVPAGARDAKDLVVEVRVQLNQDGTVRQAQVVDQGRMGDPLYRAAAESARRAFYNPQCTPLKLPPEKYGIWKDLVVDFNPKDIL